MNSWLSGITSESNKTKDIGCLIIQTYPMYDNERCSRLILSEINAMYLLLVYYTNYLKNNTFCWMAKTFIEKIDNR